jgi:alpha-glucosidase (family GH31 glycosyl hydrolase)
MSGAEYHNLYPQAWAELTREAVESVNNAMASDSERRTETESDVVYFTRSAWTFSPPAVPVFWLGDQLQSWDAHDGLASALIGALSSGLTGQTVTHSDIGGYNAFLSPSPINVTYVRDAELLQRWAEFAAFGSALFRTHIGSSTSPQVTQVYDSPGLLKHFAEFASIYGNLSSVRLSLMEEARDRGLPLIR